jgi:hypothetical protein
VVVVRVSLDRTETLHSSKIVDAVHDDVAGERALAEAGGRARVLAFPGSR